jgi:hypothetical protein
MKRTAPVIAIAIILFAAPWNTVLADPFIDKGLNRAAVIVLDQRMDTFNEVRYILSRGGACALHAFPPKVVFGKFPASIDESDFSGLPVELISSAVELAPGVLDPVTGRVIRTLFNEHEILRSAVVPDMTGFRDLVLGIPEEIRRKHYVPGPRKGAPREIVARSMEQNAEFLIGTVLANVIFPESAGGRENWTDEELGDAMVDIAIGLSDYQQKAHWVQLDFVYNYYKNIPVSIEPIDGDWNYDPIWISDTMDYLEVEDGDYISRVHFLNNETRMGFGTDWVFTAFVVDASNNVCWRGPNGYYVAYTIDLGGPYMVVPYPACRFGTGVGFSHVFIHEMSHIFYALDEYMVEDPDLAYWDCDAHSGYLAIPNRNTLIRQCQEVTDCIMNNAQLYLPLPVCPYTLGQVGLWDENENSIPDLFEMAPSIEFLNIPGVVYDTIDVNSTVIAARATNDAVPNKNPYQDKDTRVDYAPWLAKGIYWVNNQLANEIRPSDRQWDESSEDIGFIFSGLTPGLNILHLKVENNVGIAAEAAKEIYYIGIKYEMISARVESEYIDLDWVTAAEVFDAVFTVMREDITSGGGLQKIAEIDTFIASGGNQNQYTYRDESIAPGHEYRYLINAGFDLVFKGEMKHYEFPSKSIYKTAMLPVGEDLSSNLLPNPTTGRTSFTVDIPKSFYDPTGGSRTSRNGSTLGAPALSEVKTPVDIAVYNVLGRRISTIYSRSRFGGLETYTWDGLDRNGSPVPQGVYFIRIVAGDKSTVKKVVIIR